MIEGVKIISLRRIADDRGFVTEILRSDADHFVKFGQVYVSSCRKNIIKAWHAHRKQIDHMYVVKGTAKLGLFDDREGSPTRGEYMQVILGAEGADALLIIPPLVWHGQMALSEMSYLINIPTELYNYEDPDELRKPVEAFEDIWTVKSR